MAVVWDAFARTFMVTGPLPEKAVVRSHYFQDQNEKRVVQRQRMRSGAREVLTVLASSAKRLTFNQLRAHLPHVSVDTLQVRLSLLTSRGDVSRTGERGSFTYSLPSSSTFMSSKW